MRINRDLIIYAGWLQIANNFDWDTGPRVSQKQKRAVPDGSIVINCQPQQLKLTLPSDYPNGIYWDQDMGEYVLKTPAIDACMGSVDADNPMLLVQKSVVGQKTFYTIFICAAAQNTVFKPDLTIFNFVQALADATSSTMWRERGTTWNLGPLYSIMDLIMIDTMFLAALLAIAQQSQSYSVYSPFAPGMVNLWVACFQSGAQHWNNPSKSYLYTLTDAVILYVLC